MFAQKLNADLPTRKKSNIELSGKSSFRNMPYYV